MAGQTVIVSVLADTKRFDAGLNKASASLRNFSRGVSKFSGVVTLGVGLAATAFTKFVASSVMSAAELEQALGGSEVVFGKYYKNIEMWGSQAYKNLGLAQNDYTTSANVLGVFLKGAGVSAKNLTGETDKLLQRGADVAALFGGSTVDAINAFASALKGEYNPIEAYGVVLSEAVVQQKAFAMTGKTVAKELTAQEKQAARLALIYEKTDLASGRFAAEATTFAGGLAIFNARLQNFLNDVGGKLLPTLSGVFPQLTEEINKFVASKEFETFVSDLNKAILQLVKSLPALAKGLAAGFNWISKPENQKALAEVLAAIIALPTAINGLSASFKVLSFVGGALGTVWTLLKAVAGGWSLFATVVGEGKNIITGLKGLEQMRFYLGGVVAAFQDYLRLATKAGPIQRGAARAFLWIAQATKFVVQGLMDAGPVLSKVAGFFAKFAGVFSKVFGVAFGIGSKFLGWITLAFYGLQPIIAYLIAYWEGVVYIWGRAWESFAQVASDMWLIVSTLFIRAGEAIGKFFTDLGTWFLSTPVGEWVMGFVGMLGNAWVAVTEWWNSEALKPFRDFLGGVWEAMTDPFWLFKISNDFFQGLLKGLKANVDSIFDWFDGVWDDIIAKAKKALGIASPSKVMKSIGVFLGKGLAIGIDSTQKLVTRASDGLYSASLSGFDTPFSPAPAGASAASGAVYNVTVNALTPSPEVGRIVVKSIQDYERTGGTR